MHKLSIHNLVLTGFVLWIGSYAYLYTYQITGLKPLYTYFVLLGFTICGVLSAPSAAVIRGRGVQQILVWLLVFGIYTCFSWFMSSHSETATQIFITWMESVLILGVFSLLFCNAKDIKQIQLAFVFIAIMAVVMNLYDFLVPTFSNVPGRAAGFYENPNIAGKFIAMSMVAGIGLVPRRMRLWYVLLCGIGVLVTFSRSSWLIWLIGFIGLVWIGVIGPGRYRKISVILVAIIAAIMMALMFSGKLGEVVVNSPLANYLDSNTSARLGIGGGQFDSYAKSERMAAAKEGLEQGAEVPLLGHGLGFTRELGVGWATRVSTHNMYLLFWAEGGIVGLTLYLWLLILLFRHSSGIGRVIALQYAFVGLFSHNLLDQPASMIVLAFALIPGDTFYRRTIHNSQPLQATRRA